MALATRKNLLLGAAALAVIAGAALFAAIKGPFAPVQVSVAAAKQAALKRSVFGIGTVEARLAYAVGPTQAARVLKVRVDHGDAVSAGDALAELDPVDLAERLAGSEAAIAKAKQLLRAAEAQLREAESRNQLALANASRYRELAHKGFVSNELADGRLGEANVTRAGVDAAQATVSAGQRDLERLARERDATARQLRNLRLTAPVDGVVVARLAEPGTTVVAGQAVIRLVDPNSVWVRARIDQARAGGLRIGDRAEIVLRSQQGAPLSGRVARIDIQSDAVTEERLVGIEIEPRPAGLSLGELAEVTIVQPELRDALIVPSAAVKWQNHAAGVWRIDGGRARYHAVKAGAQSLDGQTQILEGLQSGDEVIVHASAQLAEGLRVKSGGRE